MPPSEFILLPFPPLQKKPQSSDISIYFSPKNPDTLSINLLAIPVPSCAVEVEAALWAQWQLGTRSIVLTMANGVVRYLPLWLPDIWVPLLPALHAQPKWTTAYTWYQAKILSNGLVPAEFSHLPDAIGLFFSVIGWNVRIRTPSAAFNSVRLTDLFSNNYLTGEVMDHLVEMIQVWTTRYPKARTDIFLDTLNFQVPFTGNIRNSVSWEAFDTDRPGQLAHLRRIADDIRANKFTSVLCPIHDARIDHYFAAFFDASSGQLFIGDSLGGRSFRAMDDGVYDGFRLFCGKIGRSALGFPVKELPRSIQDDGYSCGIVTCNTIERVVFPNVRPWSPATKELERAEFALLLATQLGSQYGLVRP